MCLSLRLVSAKMSCSKAHDEQLCQKTQAWCSAEEAGSIYPQKIAFADMLTCRNFCHASVYDSAETCTSIAVVKNV